MTYEMLEDDRVEDMVKLITERILTPVLYMYCDEIVEFVCFCDTNMPIEVLHDTEREIFEKFGIEAELVDIREFEDADRWEIVSNAEPVYRANELVGALFEGAMYADMEKSESIRGEVVERMNETGTYYLQ